VKLVTTTTEQLHFASIKVYKHDRTVGTNVTSPSFQVTVNTPTPISDKYYKPVGMTCKNLSNGYLGNIGGAA